MILSEKSVNFSGSCASRRPLARRRRPSRRGCSRNRGSESGSEARGFYARPPDRRRSRSRWVGCCKDSETSAQPCTHPAVSRSLTPRGHLGSASRPSVYDGRSLQIPDGNGDKPLTEANLDRPTKLAFDFCSALRHTKRVGPHGSRPMIPRHVAQALHSSPLAGPRAFGDMSNLHKSFVRRRHWRIQ